MGVASLVPSLHSPAFFFPHVAKKKKAGEGVCQTVIMTLGGRGKSCDVSFRNFFGKVSCLEGVTYYKVS